MRRREFSKSARLSMIKRATRDGQTWCELCNLPCKRWEYHHTIEEALVIDKGKPLTKDDGLLICKPCHKEITTTQSIPRVAKAKRQEAAALGVKAPNRRPIPARPKEAKERRPVATGAPSLMRRGFEPA